MIRNHDFHVFVSVTAYVWCSVHDIALYFHYAGLVGMRF